MQSMTQYIGLVCRLYLSAFFLSHLAMYFATPAQTATLGPFHHALRGELAWQSASIALLLGVCGVLLLLGLRSRVVAVTGVVICTAAFLAQAGFNHTAILGTGFSPDRYLAFLAIVMVALVGGGKWSLRRGGWRLSDVV